MPFHERMPNVIVLILTFNGKKLLEDSVSSYLNNNYPNFKIVVVDNGSSDGTSNYLQENFPEVSVIRLEKNRGYSGGFNFGLKYAISRAATDYVLVTNDDVKVDRELISELVKVAMRDYRIGFVTGEVFFHDFGGKKNILQTVGKVSDKFTIVGEHIGEGEEDIGQHDKIEEREFCDDVFTLVNAELIKKTGGYDENFYLQFEETDWQLRA